MGAWFLCRDDARADARIAGARVQFRRHRLAEPAEAALPGWRLLHSPYVNGGPACHLVRGDDLVAVAGTLCFDGRMGQAALERLLDAVVPGRAFSGWDRLTGHFAALVHKGGETLLLTDYLGAFQLFHHVDGDVFSTSLLSVLGAAERLRWDAQGVYEFAFNVFPIGDDTVFEQVKRLGPERQLRLGADGSVTSLASSKPLPEGERVRAPEETARVLAEAAAPFVAEFGQAMDCPLSGGFDSRLALALLRSHGVRPHLYVYGEPDSPDVAVAQAIAKGEGFDLEVVDKWAEPVTPDAFAEIVERNFHETDGLTTDGGLFDNGGNARARDRRQRGGRLTVSGGCGEIFRNFFYLDAKPRRVRALVDAFYSTYAKSDVTDAFDERAYRAALEAKVAATLSASSEERLPRWRLDQAYPRVRCRAFFGREISLVGRFGAYFMPFLEHWVVAEAATLPVREKSYGMFQARLIAAIDPALARHPSAYGHSFVEPPSAAMRRAELATTLRPLWLRRRSYALRRKLGPVADDHGGLLSADYLGRVIDLEFPAMRRFFRTDAIGDAGVYRRVATMERLAAWLGARLEG